MPAQKAISKFDMLTEFYRAKRISTNFDKDIKTLGSSFINAVYPKRFISHTINNCQDDIIPNFLFEERKKVFIKLPFCRKNEKLRKTFIAKLNKFTNFNFNLNLIMKFGKTEGKPWFGKKKKAYDPGVLPYKKRGAVIIPLTV